MKKFLFFLITIVLVGVIAVAVVFKLGGKPTPGESSGTPTESTTKPPQSTSDKPQESSGGTSEEPGDGELKITLDCTQWTFSNLNKIDSGESGGGSESGGESGGKVTGIEIKPGEILFGEE